MSNEKQNNRLSTVFMFEAERGGGGEEERFVFSARGYL
jgi:hypothetical protein